MVIELIVLAVVTLVGVIFILNARSNFTEEELDRRLHSEVPTADESEPTQTGRFKAKAMLNRSLKESGKKNDQNEPKVQQPNEEESEALPDPFEDR
jgi:hypothetical protein